MPDAVVASANVCQIVVPFVALSAYLPQWIKLCRTKSSANISLRSWCLWIVTSLFGLFYATVQLLLNGRGWPLVISATFALGSVLLTVYFILRYRPRSIAV